MKRLISMVMTVMMGVSIFCVNNAEKHSAKAEVQVAPKQQIATNESYSTGSGKVIDALPPIPTITKFSTIKWDAGWYRMETNLQLGTAIYSVDFDPNRTEWQTENEDNYRIKTLPEKYIGSDYVINRRAARKDIFFNAEQDITVYAAIDSQYSSSHSWLYGWTSTGDTMITNDNRTYNIYERNYPMGVVIISKLGGSGDSGRNYFLMAMPQHGLPVSKLLTHNPVLAEGAKPSGSTADDEYKYYINDVFNEDYKLPDGYTAFGVDSSNSAALVDTSSGQDEEINFALNSSFIASNNKNGQSPVDGSIDTYWQTVNVPENLVIDLRETRTLHKLVLKLRDYWDDRTQSIQVSGSVDGINYSIVIPRKDYLFKKAAQNILTEEIAAEIRYLKIDVYSNTGDNGAQISEVEAYGYDYATVDNKVIAIDKTEWAGEAVGVVKVLDAPVSGKVILETRIKTTEKNQSMNIPLIMDSSGKTAVSVKFDGNGYITAGNVSAAPYTSGKWCNVKLVIDTQNKTYDIWVDHLVRAKSVAFTENAVNLKKIQFSVARYSEGGLEVDYLRLFDNTETFLYTEDFNRFDKGSRPADWTATDASNVLIAEVPFKEDKSLKIENKGAKVTASKSFEEVSGDITIESKVKPMNSSWVTAPLVTDSSGKVAVKVALYRNSIFISNGDNWVYVCNEEIPNNYYEAGNWFYIKLVINTHTNRYDFYVDGAKRYSGASLVEDVSEVSKISFTAEQENVLYVDGIKIYDSTSLSRGLLPTENVFNVKDFGAIGDGVTDDTEAIYKAIQAAAGIGGTVLLENGVFYTGQITLRSDMTLFIDSSAKIFFKMNRNLFTKVIPSNGYNGNKQLGRGNIYFQDVKNVRITGGGTIDGNGFYGFDENDPPNQRPCILYFAASEDVVVENVDMIRSPFWTLVPYESTHMTIRNVNITNHAAPNRDGIDPVNSSNITVENCKVIAGDDAFCPKSGNRIPSVNVEVRDCFFQSYCNGIKFGTDSQGPFRNYIFEDIYMKGVGMSGIALEAVDGSEIEYITFKRIDMNDVDNAMFAAVGNRMRTPIGVTNPDSYKRLGYIRNIIVEDMNFTNPMLLPYSHKDETIHEILIYGLSPDRNTLNDGKDHRVSNVLFKNVYLEMPGGMQTVPNFSNGLGGQYPEHEALGTSVGYGYTLRWTDNIRFENCTTVVTADDVRQDIAMADFTDTEIKEAEVAEYVLGVQDKVVKKGVKFDELNLPETADILLETGRVVTVNIASWNAVGSYDETTEGVYYFKATFAASSEVKDIHTLSAETRVIVNTKAASLGSDGGRRGSPLSSGGIAGLVIGIVLFVNAIAALAIFYKLGYIKIGRRDAAC